MEYLCFLEKRVANEILIENEIREIRMAFFTKPLHRLKSGITGDGSLDTII